MRDSHPRGDPLTSSVRRVLLWVTLTWACALAHAAPADSLAAVAEWRNTYAAVEEPSLEALQRGAQLLWRAADEIALAGQTVPHELPALVHHVRTLRDMPLPRDRARLLASGIVQYCDELLLRSREPGAIGELSAARGGTYTAGDFAELRQSYRLGDRAMGPGSAFLLGTHWVAGPALQADVPGDPNFVSVAASRAGVRFAHRYVRRGGIHGGYRQAEPLLLFELVDGRLEPGDRVEFVYGDRRGGSPGLAMPEGATDSFVLPLYLRLDAEGGYLSLPPVAHVVEGGAVERLRVLVPSRVAPGEPFSMRVVSLDRYGNRASGRAPSYEVLLNGLFVRRIPESYGGIASLDDLRIDDAGFYHFELRSSGGGISGLSNAVEVTRSTDRVYWGNLHAHSDLSDGIGSAESYFERARADAALQFAALPEHDRWLDRWEWERLRRAVERERATGEFTPFLGFEWSAPVEAGGHHQVVFADTTADALFGQEVAELSEFYYRLRGARDPDRVVVIASGTVPGDWRLADPRLLRLVEVVSGAGTFQWLGDLYSKQGHRVGFVGSSASHAGRALNEPFGGLTAVIARKQSPDEIFHALRERHVYATSGARILLDVEVNDGRMGERVANDDSRFVRGYAAGNAPIVEVELYRNGERRWRDRADRREERWSPGDEVAISVEFNSDSAPFETRRDLPRQEREWLGFIQVTGCQSLALIESRSAAQHLALNRRGANRADFLVRTRGAARGFAVTAAGAREEMEIEIYVANGRESGLEEPLLRPPSETPAVRQRVALQELLRGDVVRRIDVNGYNDEITLRLVSPDAPLVRRFEYLDQEGVRPGDFYYVRVRQADGHYAWSSPVWVGGADLR